MFETPPQYYTFVLRIWEERSDAEKTAVWRYSLHNSDESNRIGFNSLEELTHYLQAMLNLSPPDSEQ